MSSSRRRFTHEQKAQIVRRHLANKESDSAISEEFCLQPSQIHLWVNTLLAQAGNDRAKRTHLRGERSRKTDPP